MERTEAGPYIRVNRDGQSRWVTSAYPPKTGVMADMLTPTLRANCGHALGKIMVENARTDAPQENA
jgi:hypothetical protein